MTVLIITKDVLNNYSKKWRLESHEIAKIGLIKEMIDEELDVSMLKLENVYDDIFSHIYKMLKLDQNKIDVYLNLLNSTCTIRFLHELYKTCDYLKIFKLQTLISKYIALRVNSMSFNELEYTVVNLFDV